MRLLALLFVLLSFPAAAAAAPVVGVYSEGPSATAGAAQADTGFASVRRPWSWAMIEPRRGRFDFGNHDAMVGAAARKGLTILPFLVEAPKWAVDQPAGETGMRPPRDVADFARFAAAAVRRWGPDGSFWSTHPAVPYHPIRAWQVWNEPNLPAFWRPEPDAGAYVELLRAGSAAIRAADPDATVVAAGLPESQGGIPQTQYLQQLYAHGVKGLADAMAVHAYAPDSLGVVALVSGARKAMLARGDHSPLWITEFGWASAGEPSLFTVSEPQQATLLAESIYALRALASPLQLGGLFVFRWQDPAERVLTLDIWPYHGGLVRGGRLGEARARRLQGSSRRTAARVRIHGDDAGRPDAEGQAREPACRARPLLPRLHRQPRAG